MLASNVRLFFSELLHFVFFPGFISVNKDFFNYRAVGKIQQF